MCNLIRPFANMAFPEPKQEVETFAQRKKGKLKIQFSQNLIFLITPSVHKKIQFLFFKESTPMLYKK